MDIVRLVEQTFVKKVRITLQDEVHCIISGLHKDHSDFFVEEYALHVKGYFFQPKYKLGVWDGKKKFFTDDGHTYVNLLDELVPKIKSFGYKIEINDKRLNDFTEVDQIDSEYFSHIINPKTDEPWEVRPYQVDSLNQLFEHGFGIIIAGTGAGKTSINAALVDNYGKHGLKSITIVPSISLVSQTIREFKLLGLDVGEYSGDNKDLDHIHIISTWQSLQNYPQLISKFNVIVIDECHGAKASVIGGLINEYGKHIVHRFGLTGTLPDHKVDSLMVRLSLGPVRYTIAASTLISSGWLSIPNITVVQLDDQRRIEQLMEQNETTKDPDEKITYDNEIAFLNSDKLRWSWIASFIVEKGSAQKGNVLCLVSSVIVGKRLAKLIPNSTFLYGKDKQEVRQRVYDLFETNDDLIVIATVQIAGVGLSIDRIFNLCYVDGGKSFVRTIQTIGRGLRKGKDKDSVDIIDICGNLKYSKDHLTKRIKYYKGAHYKYKKLLVEYSENVEIIR